jgi:hypothetical protein
VTKEERQITLQTRMYRKKSFGKENYCTRCWACYHYESCIADAKIRSVQCLCVKAEERLTGQKKYDDSTEFQKIIRDKRVRSYRFPLLGLKKEEL